MYFKYLEANVFRLNYPDLITCSCPKLTIETQEKAVKYVQR